MAISILGAGAWGTAIAISLGSKKDVILWTHNETTFESINGKEKVTSYPVVEFLIMCQ